MKIQGFALACLLTVCGVFHSAARCNAQSSFEEMQAAYIYNFGKYIRWPNEFSTFVVGVYGDDATPFMAVLEDAMADRRIGGKPIQIKQIASAEAATRCNIIYFPYVENDRVRGVADALAGVPVLIVTEEDMVRKGAMISFFVEDDRLRFLLRKDLLKKAGLTASDGLLRIATVY